MNWNILGFFRRDWTEHRFKTLVDCKILERRREERRLAERRATKHQFQAIKSCIADARNYRVARKLPFMSMAHFD
jgi:virulence-associated protein VapD